MNVLAHGLGNIQDPILPLWLFYYGASIVLVLSFVALGALWKEPRLAGRAGTLLGDGVSRTVRALRIPFQALSFFLLVVVFWAALVGEPSAALNIAPVFVLVVFWLGLPALSILLGDVWRALNPWAAAADAVAWLWHRLGRSWETPFAYPEQLGRWPAAVLLFAFATLELAYSDPSNPRALAVAIALYSWITWVAILAFGRETWLRYGEAFAVYFALFARMAPFEVRDGRLARRSPLARLAEPDPTPGTAPMVAVMLGSVLFDGFSRTTWWLDRRFSVEEPFALDNPGLADLAGTGLNLAGLIAAVLLVGGLFRLAIAVAERVGRAGRDLTGDFVNSLIPIAGAYLVAHYFSYFVLQGQLAIRLVSDPLGRGWDVFGTADFTGWIASLSPNTVWYVQVAALVVGHVAGLVIAHERAVTLFRGKTASRTQYAMLALMVVYTVGGLWVLSSG